MRTVDLIKAFSDEELGEIKTVIARSAKPRQIGLFNELSKSKYKDTAPDNAVLFKKTFGKVYTKQHDYQLRHELRVLNETLYLYLAERTARIHIHKKADTYDYWLARGYYDRQMHALFQADIADLIKDATARPAGRGTINPSFTTALHSLRSLWMVDHQLPISANLEIQMDAIRQWKEEEKKQFIFRIRQMELREAYITYVINNQVLFNDIPDDLRTAGETIIDFSDIEANDLALRYRELQKHSYQTKNIPRIEVLKESLKMIETKEGWKILGLKYKIDVLNQLGIELSMIGHYQEANKYMGEYLNQSEEYKIPFNVDNIYNYIVNHVNLGKYEEGIAKYEQYKNVLENSKISHISRIILSYCFLYMGDADKALKVLPKDSELPHIQVIGRFVYAISFLMREEYALAVYEIKNLRRAIKANKASNAVIALQIAELYLRYATAYTKNKDEGSRILSALKNEMAENYNEWHIKAGMNIQLHWLMQKLVA